MALTNAAQNKMVLSFSLSHILTAVLRALAGQQLSL
jgi:hypothetical protein